MREIITWERIVEMAYHIQILQCLLQCSTVQVLTCIPSIMQNVRQIARQCNNGRIIPEDGDRAFPL
jgi:hypothetical protein